MKTNVAEWVIILIDHHLHHRLRGCFQFRRGHCLGGGGLHISVHLSVGGSANLDGRIYLQGRGEETHGQWIPKLIRRVDDLTVQLSGGFQF